MAKHHPENERIKRDYFAHLAKFGRMAEASIEQAAAAISLFEESTNHRDFHKFNRAQAVAFTARQREYVNPKTGRPIAFATISSRVRSLKAFFTWLAAQPGYRSKMTVTDVDYFNLSANEERAARATRQRPAPTVEEVLRAIDAMPTATLVNRRDRAVLAFALLSGARDNVIASFRLKHVVPEERSVFHDAREVRSKNAKTFVSIFFPVSDRIEAIVADWIAELVALGYGPDDPLFPSTAVRQGQDKAFAAVGLTRDHWQDASAVRRIFRRAFEGAGLPYYQPHSLRRTLTIEGERRCRTPEQWKAYSQNFGHSSPMTTFIGYGEVPQHRQAEILSDLAAAKNEDHRPLDAETIRRVLDHLKKTAA